MANPLVSIAVPVAGILAAKLGTKAAETGWGAVFGEDAPTTKSQKAAQKEVAARRKQMKKDGKAPLLFRKSLRILRAVLRFRIHPHDQNN